MHKLCFDFKFVDHDNQKKHTIVLEIFCNKRVEWEHSFSEEGMEAKIQHKIKLLKWKHKLHKRVMEWLKNIKGEEHFRQFKFIKECKKGECTIVNLTPGEGHSETLHLKKIHSVMKCAKKFSKGHVPEPWTKIFGYQHVCHVHQFYVDVERNGEGGSKFEELGKHGGFTTPPNWEGCGNRQQSHWMQSNLGYPESGGQGSTQFGRLGQFGGWDDDNKDDWKNKDKYLKYKNKYLALKKREDYRHD